VLKRLAQQGAFVGIAADENEKASLRAWLEAESARLDDDRRAIESLNAEIGQTRAEIDRDIAAFSARAATAGNESDARVLEARRQSFNANLMSLNDRMERNAADVDHFNREVTRYNLMIAYPDGLDEEAAVRQKRAPSGAGPK
jgi:chromosome segregation ATPase